MEPAYIVMTIFLALIAIGAPIIHKEWCHYRLEMKEAKEDIKKCNIKHVITETKVDILLDRNGIDVAETNNTIKKHMDELQKNDVPHVGKGCIIVKELLKKE